MQPQPRPCVCLCTHTLRPCGRGGHPWAPVRAPGVPLPAPGALPPGPSARGGSVPGGARTRRGGCGVCPPSVPGLETSSPSLRAPRTPRSLSLADALAAPPRVTVGLTPHLHVEAVSKQAESSIFRRNVLHSEMTKANPILKGQGIGDCPFLLVPSVPARPPRAPLPGPAVRRLCSGRAGVRWEIRVSSCSPRAVIAAATIV